MLNFKNSAPDHFRCAELKKICLARVNNSRAADSCQAHWQLRVLFHWILISQYGIRIRPTTVTVHAPRRHHSCYPRIKIQIIQWVPQLGMILWQKQRIKLGIATSSSQAITFTPKNKIARGQANENMAARMDSETTTCWAAEGYQYIWAHLLNYVSHNTNGRFSFKISHMDWFNWHVQKIVILLGVLSI